MVDGPGIGTMQQAEAKQPCLSLVSTPPPVLYIYGFYKACEFVFKAPPSFVSKPRAAQWTYITEWCVVHEAEEATRERERPFVAPSRKLDCGLIVRKIACAK